MEAQNPDDANNETGASSVEQMIRNFDSLVPHNRALGIEIVHLEPSVAILALPYREDLVGNPSTGVLHGGAITSLLDAATGMAVFMGLKVPRPIATLDLRVDYLKPALPEARIIARAECYKISRHVAFVRGIAYQGDEEVLIASAAGTFMLGTTAATPSKPAEPKAATE